MIRWLLIIVLCWILFVFLPIIPPVRNLLASPLVVKDRDPRGDSCYILAGTDEFRERLAAAAELYNQGRISRIIFMRKDEPSSYNYVAKARWTATEWALDFLIHRGVPQDRIQLIDHISGPLGTLQEARNLKKSRPADLKKLVLVSSAPHMRRSLLAFRRVLPPDITIVSCPASSFSTSYEYFYPLWIEYLKLAVYSVVAK